MENSVNNCNKFYFFKRYLRRACNKRDNIKFTSYSVVNDVTEKLIKSLSFKISGWFRKSMKGSGFIFDLVQLMYYNCHKINSKCGGSCTDSPDQIKKKRATINRKNKDEKCFQYAATVANIIPFINKYNWEEISYPSKLVDQKTFEKSNPTNGLNVLYTKDRSSRSQIFFKIGVLKISVNFTGKHLCWSLFLIKLREDLGPATLLKRDSNTDVFLLNFKNTFFTEYLRRMLLQRKRNMSSLYFKS